MKAVKKEHDAGNVLGPLEQEILETLWSLGNASGKDVHSSVRERRDVALTTVLTVIERLVKKGVVIKQKTGGPYLYRAAMSREELTEELSAGVFKGLLELSASGAAASFVNALGDSDPGELDRLARLVESKRRELADRSS